MAGSRVGLFDNLNIPIHRDAQHREDRYTASPLSTPLAGTPHSRARRVHNGTWAPRLSHNAGCRAVVEARARGHLATRLHGRATAGPPTSGALQPCSLSCHAPRTSRPDTQSSLRGSFDMCMAFACDGCFPIAQSPTSRLPSQAHT